MSVLAMVALGIVSFVIWQAKHSPQTSGAPRPNAAVGAVVQKLLPAQALANTTSTPSATPAAGVGDLVGSATGILRFALPAGGGAPDVVVELVPQAAVGVWMPDQKRLRIALLDHRPEHVEASQTMDSVADLRGVFHSGQAAAVVELTFVPTAQAFTPDEVESVLLVVTDRLGRSSSADITGSVQWSGGLAAAEVSTATTNFQLQSTGSGTSDGTVAREQAWSFSTELPVGMRR
jgi:hypothetical protein